MALTTYTLGVQASKKLSNDVVVQNVTVNAATTNVDQSVDGTIELFNIPQGALVHSVSIYIATVEDSAATLTLGDGADADTGTLTNWSIIGDGSLPLELQSFSID